MRATQQSARAYSWSWADYHALHGETAAPAPRAQTFFGGNKRSSGTLSRFVGTSHHADRSAAALPPNHPALREGRTLFPSSVVAADDAPRLLVSGINSAKLGKKVSRGPWRGMPIYQLTLEERATCPGTCSLLAECFGNAMPFARRHRHGPELEDRLCRDVATLAAEHRRGFVVRLHVLGDFYSPDYARMWLMLMVRHPELRVFGYTAHQRGSETGDILLAANDRFAGRWSMRTSVSPDAPHDRDQATTIWRHARGRQPEGVVCPAQTDDTDACGTCGLCWLPQAASVRIVFIGHGKNKRSSAR